MGFPDSRASAGYTEKISFQPHNVFERFQNGTLVVSTRYSIQQEYSDSVIYFAEPEFLPQIIRLRSIDTLILYDDAADGYENVFCRAR